MKALSIRQPWADLIMRGIKRVENRTWPTHYRGRLAIHAGLKIDRPALEFFQDEGLVGKDLPRGVILGTVELLQVVELHEVHGMPYAEGPWCWIVGDPRPLPEPVACAGQLSLFDCPVEVG